MCVTLFLLVGVEFDLDTRHASLALHGCCSLSNTAHSRPQLCVFDPSSPEGSVPSFPKDLGKACAHSFCVRFGSRERQPILPPTFGSSARIVSSCFTRPRFELGHSSRAPRVRLSCSIKSQVFSFMRHDVLNVGRPRHI